MTELEKSALIREGIVDAWTCKFSDAFNQAEVAQRWVMRVTKRKSAKEVGLRCFCFGAVSDQVMQSTPLSTCSHVLSLHGSPSYCLEYEASHLSLFFVLSFRLESGFAAPE